MFQKYILDKKREIIGSICDLVSFPSISNEYENNNFPFGKACNDCLKYFLNLSSSLGFKTKNVDGYCGWAEFGQGDELIGIVGHLDVVPAKDEDWSSNPFIATIANHCIYGRGVIDDKGPVIACLYAMKSVMDYMNENNITFNKRVRLIVGLNEEKDWKCIDYYKKYEEIPSIGFSPDSNFPCIYAEKSVLSLNMSQNLSDINVITKNKFSSNSPAISIIDIDTDNNAINVVPRFCSFILKVQNKNYMENLIKTCKSIINKYKYDIYLYKIDDLTLKLSSYGTASHSAHPELGNNAISKLILMINELFNSWNISFPMFKDFCNYIGDDYTGKNLNIDIKDESGILTLNTSQIYIKDNKIYISINLRIPIHTNPNKIIEIFKKYFNYDINVIKVQPSLYVDKNSDLVKNLTSVFNKVCSSNVEPIAIGGATYARAFDNFVCFGMIFPGDKDMCHQVDEYIEIDKLLLSTNIYANAIYKLLL